MLVQTHSSNWPSEQILLRCQNALVMFALAFDGRFAMGFHHGFPRFACRPSNSSMGRSWWTACCGASAVLRCKQAATRMSAVAARWSLRFHQPMDRSPMDTYGTEWRMGGWWMHPIYHIYPSTAIVRSLFLSFLICFWICWSLGPDPFQANDSTRFLSHHLEALRTGKLMPRTAGSRRYMLREVFVPISREYIYIYISYIYIIISYIYISYLIVIIYIYTIFDSYIYIYIFDSYNIYVYIPYLIVIYIYISYLIVIIYIPYLIVIYIYIIFDSYNKYIYPHHIW